LVAPQALLTASYAARCVACQGVRSQAVPVALVGEFSMPAVLDVARPPIAASAG